MEEPGFVLGRPEFRTGAPMLATAPCCKRVAHRDFSLFRVSVFALNVA